MAVTEKGYVVEHGSPFDRGARDAYYSGFPSPHKLVPTGNGAAMEEVPLFSEVEIEAYYAGFDSISPYDRKQYE
jgi:hypothetical protein